MSALALYVLRWAALPLLFLALHELFRAFYLHSIRRVIYAASDQPFPDSEAVGEEIGDAPVPLQLSRVDAHTSDPVAVRSERAIARAASMRMRVVFGASGAVYLLIAAVMVWHSAISDGAAPTRAIWLGYVFTGAPLIVLLGFARVRWVFGLLALIAWLASGIALRMALVKATWQSATLDLVIDGLRVLTPPVLTVGLLMMRRFRPLLVALVPTALFVGALATVVAIAIQAVVPGGSSAFFAARPVWFANWMLVFTPLPTIAGVVIGVRAIRHGIRRRVVLVLLALLIVGFAMGAAGSRVAVLAGVCFGVAINALSVFAVWAIVSGFLRLKQRGDLPDEVLHSVFCWFALTWFTAALAGYDRPYTGWSLLPLAACIATLLVALAYERRHAGVEPAKRMLLLRVFGSARARTRLIDRLDESWRRVGSIDVTVGLDLALRTLGALALGNYLLGRVHRQFLTTPADVVERLPAAVSSPGLDGRYPLRETYCTSDMWPSAVARLVPAADVVLMDLRGLQATNRGALYEVSLVLRRVSLARIVVLTDRATDESTLVKVIQHTWRRLPQDSPNRGARHPQLRLLHCSDRGAASADAIEAAVFAAAFDASGSAGLAAT
jgi:hypothetical protein